MAGNWGAEEELFPVYRPSEEGADKTEKKSKKHKKKHKKSSKSSKRHTDIEIQNPGERSGKDERKQRHTIQISALPGQTQAHPHAFGNTTDFFTKGVGKLTDAMHITEHGVRNTTNQAGHPMWGVDAHDWVGGIGKFATQTTDVVEKGMKGVGTFTVGTVEGTAGIITKGFGTLTGHPTETYSRGSSQDGGEGPRRASAASSSSHGGPEDFHPHPWKAVEMTTGAIIKGFEKTSGAVVKGFETSIEATTDAVSKSVEVLTGHHMELHDPVSSHRASESASIIKLSGVVDQVRKQKDQARMEGIDPSIAVNNEVGKLHGNSGVEIDHHGKISNHDHSMGINEVVRSKKRATIFQRHDVPGAADDKAKNPFKDAVGLVGFKQVAGVVTAAKGIGASGRRQEERVVDEVVANASSDSDVDESAMVQEIQPINASYSAMYWKKGLGIPENGTIDIRGTEFLFSGKVSTKLRFRLDDIHVEKASSTGGLGNAGFQIIVRQNRRSKTEKPSKERYLFSAVLKDREEVMNTIEAAINVSKLSGLHRKLSSMVIGEDDSSLGDAAATIHTMTTVAKKESGQNKEFFAKAIRAIMMQFRRLSIFGTCNLHDAVENVRMSVKELDDSRLKSSLGGAKSMDMAREIKTMQECLRRIEKIGLSDETSSVPRTIEKRTSRVKQ